uniref:Uncharacterized protein n=1 Tax=Oryza nivara TaxID=4536 RepID=A0A0E0HRK6_ORYNI
MERSTSHDVYMSVPRFFCILSHIRDFDIALCGVNVVVDSSQPHEDSLLLAGITYCWMRPSTVLPGMHTMYSWSYRQKLRATFGMAPEPCADCCLQLFCDRCSLSQMYRELKNRGVNPANVRFRVVFGFKVFSEIRVCL